MDPRCEQLSHVDQTNFRLSLLILVGILVSYLPQHIRIIARRSSFGLSPWFVLLGTTSGTCAFANILVMPKSRLDVGCCRQVDDFACVAGLLGIAQVGVQWTCFTVILLLFLIFFPREAGATSSVAKTAPTSQLEPSTDDTADSIQAPSSTEPAASSLTPTYRTALLVTLISLVHALITAILSFYFVYARPEHAQSWANFLGIFSTILASIQYFPQIYTTWALGRVGSLSIPMMCIQTPGSFVWAASLALRLGAEGWSAWGVYLVTGTLQGSLLIMGSYFELRHRWWAEEDSGSTGTGSAPVAGLSEQEIEEIEREVNDATEETPLLRAEG